MNYCKIELKLLTLSVWVFEMFWDVCLFHVFKWTLRRHYVIDFLYELWWLWEDLVVNILAFWSVLQWNGKFIKKHLILRTTAADRERVIYMLSPQTQLIVNWQRPALVKKMFNPKSCKIYPLSFLLWCIIFAIINLYHLYRCVHGFPLSRMVFCTLATQRPSTSTLVMQE